MTSTHPTLNSLGRRPRMLVPVAALIALGACISDFDENGGLEGNAPASGLDEQALTIVNGSGGGPTVDNELARNSCGTAGTVGLATQLVEEVACLRPGLLTRIDDIGRLSLGSGVIPYLQTPAAQALRRVAGRINGTIRINSAVRALPQQYLLRKWFERRTCNFKAAALPGSSNHEPALAIDIDAFSTWRPVLQAEGFKWIGAFDPPHFDYVRGGQAIRSLSVLAFQRLWNRNNPNDRIAEDGGYGPATEARLRRSPAGGFARGAECNRNAPEVRTGMSLLWELRGDGEIAFTAVAPAEVVRVVYQADGLDIAEALREDSPDFAATYRFRFNGPDRALRAVGFNDVGQEIALGHGMADISNGPSFSIRQYGGQVYEVGLENRPSDVNQIKVLVDGAVVRDLVTGADSLADGLVRLTLEPGQRRVALQTVGADGRIRGTLTRLVQVETSFPFDPEAHRVAIYAGMEAYWRREADGTYQLHALASPDVVRVTYEVDGFVIGESTREEGGNFPANYTFSLAQQERRFVVRGFNAEGEQVAQGVGLLDVTDGFAVYIRQRGGKLFEVGMERPPEGVASVSVEVIGEPVARTDLATQTTLSTRYGVLDHFEAGSYRFKVNTHNADGSLRGSLFRTFTVPQVR